MNEYVKDINESFSNIDLEYLNTIKTNFHTKTDKTFFASVIEKFKHKPINGLIRAIEKDILGYYELDNTETRILVIKKQHKNIDKKQLIELINKKINSVQDKNDNYENTYEYKVISILFENKKIKVNEVQRKNWHYILFETTDLPIKKYYVEFVYGTIGIYSKIKEISTEDSFLINNLSEQKIEELILKYKE